MLLLEKSQQLSFLLVASPGKKALFRGSSRGCPSERQAEPPSMSAAFHMGCTEKGGKGEENASRQETPHYIPLHIDASPVLPWWQMKLGSRTAVLPHPLPVSRVKHLLTHILSLVRIHVCPRANSPVLLQAPPPTPRPLAGPSLGLEMVMFLLGMKVASQEATPATPSRCQVPQWDTWQEHHTASIALALLWVSASLLLGFE